MELKEAIRQDVKESFNGDNVDAIVEKELSTFDYEQLDESFKGALAKFGSGAAGVLTAFGLTAVGAMTFIGGAMGGGGLAVGAVGIGAGAAALFGGLWAGQKLKDMIDFREFEKLQNQVGELMTTRDSLIKKGIEEGDPSKYKSDVKKVTKKMKSVGKQFRNFYSNHKDVIHEKLTRKEVGNLEDVIEAAEKGRLTGIKDIAQSSIA